jgi:hypothetical protein
MKNQVFIKTHNHASEVVYHRPNRISRTAFDDLYEDISDDWQERAKRLQMRRWHKIRQQHTI